MVSFVARHLHGGVRQSVAHVTVHAAKASPCSHLFFKGTVTQKIGMAASPCGCIRRRARSGARLQVVSAWGADIEWSPAKIVRTSPAAKGHQTVILEVGPGATKNYTKAGQYLQVRISGSKPGFFAIASAPQKASDGTVELLIRQKGETADLLCTAQAGAEVEASPIGGPGFKVEKLSPDEVSQIFIFATGSGISPVKALIESSALQADKRKKVKLFWGTHDAESTAYKSIIPQWEASGVEVVSVYSVDGKGYVQDVFEKENEVQDGSSVGVILCGHKEMCQDITKQFESLGVSKDRILLNF